MEQKAAHTPAPWHFRKLALCDDSHLVMFTTQNGQRAHRLDFLGEFKEADARLIASAPQLLDALQTTAANLRSWKAANGDGITTFDSWLEVVEEAIAKAKGGAA